MSLQSFLIGGLSLVIAYQKGLSLPVTFFCMTIVGMQLVEYFVWTFYDNPTVNFQASLAAVFLLFLQPIASIFTLPSGLIEAFLLPYVGLSLLSLFLDTTAPRDKYKMSRGENGHLVWHWLGKDKQTAIFLLVYFLFLFGPLLFTQNYMLLTVAIGTLGLSLYSFFKENTWGSMWCWIVNYIVVFICGRQILIAKP